MSENFKLKLNEMERQSEVVRGRIIDAAITIENEVSIALTDFFAKESAAGLFDKYIMSDTLDFNKKKEILCSLIKNNELIVKNHYENFGSDLQLIQELRNIIAHTTLCSTNEFVEQFDGSIMKYVSFTRKFWQKEITILLKPEDREKQDIKKGTYSFAEYMLTTDRIVEAIKK
jgi:hypothetical protein